jgi:hypothetical protein
MQSDLDDHTSRVDQMLHDGLLPQVLRIHTLSRSKQSRYQMSTEIDTHATTTTTTTTTKNNNNNNNNNNQTTKQLTNKQTVKRSGNK